MIGVIYYNNFKNNYWELILFLYKKKNSYYDYNYFLKVDFFFNTH